MRPLLLAAVLALALVGIGTASYDEGYYTCKNYLGLVRVCTTPHSPELDVKKVEATILRTLNRKLTPFPLVYVLDVSQMSPEYLGLFFGPSNVALVSTRDHYGPGCLYEVLAHELQHAVLQAQGMPLGDHHGWMATTRWTEKLQVWIRENYGRGCWPAGPPK